MAEERRELEERCALLEQEARHLMRVERDYYELRRRLHRELSWVRGAIILNEELLARLDPQEMSTLALQFILREMGLEKGVVFLEDQGEFSAAAFLGFTHSDDRLLKGRVLHLDGVWLEVLRQRRYQLLPGQESTRDALLDELGFTSVVVAPINGRDRLLGFVAAGSSAQGRKAFLELDNAASEMVGTIALQLGSMIENARFHRALQEQVDERTRELRQAQADLVQSAKMAAVGQLGAGVAHELNNPLCGILGYAELLLAKFEKQDVRVEEIKAWRRYVETIEREAARCKEIVEHLLSFSRKPVSVRSEPVHLGRAIGEILSILGNQLKIGNVAVVTDMSPDMAQVLGVANQLQQVFANIILNAQQAMPGGGELRIIGKNVPDADGRKIGKVQIEFTDTGGGISEKHLPRIFEPFFTTKQDAKGTGLGLSVSFHIIREHRGSIDVRSQLGAGSTFIITLPAAPINEVTA